MHINPSSTHIPRPLDFECVSSMLSYLHQISASSPAAACLMRHHPNLRSQRQPTSSDVTCCQWTSPSTERPSDRPSPTLSSADSSTFLLSRSTAASLDFTTTDRRDAPSRPTSSLSGVRYAAAVSEIDSQFLTDQTHISLGLWILIWIAIVKNFMPCWSWN